MTSLMLTLSLASVVGPTIALAAVGMPGVPVARLAVVHVAALPVSSGGGSPVASGASLCNGCKNERERQSKKQRDLVRLPTEVTQNPAFTRKGLPVQLCEYCDGDAIANALNAHNKRLSS